MPFVIPLIAGAIGLSGTAAAVFELAAGIGLSFAANKLTAKKKKASTANAPGGVRLGLKLDSNPSRLASIGEAATGGSLVYWQLSGTDNATLHMVIALADHECASLQKVFVNGKEKAWNSGTGQVTDYGANLVVRFYSGAAGQTADSELVASSGGRWTTNEKGTGVCYAVVKLTYDEKLFPDGIPEFAFVVRGAKLYDPRTGTTAWSENSAVALYNILTGISVGGEHLIGMHVPTDAIRASEAEAAANACDELVAKKAGGTEKRYRCGIVLDCSQTNRDIIETLLGTMAGEVIESGGIYRILAGVAQTPVANLTDQDLIITEPLVTREKKSRNAIVNAVYGSFTDPSRVYTTVALPPRTSTTDEAADGGIRLTRSLDLSAVTSRSQAQRVLEVERKRARRMASAQFKVRSRWFVLEPGDWVTYTSDRRGYASRTFVVQSKVDGRDLTSDIVLTETDASIDDWTASVDEIDDDQVIDLASAGPSLSAVTGVALINVTVASTGAIQRPGLQIQWDAVTDPTIVNLEVEFRKVGDTVALSPNVVSNPSVGSYTWVTGVQTGVTYEARARPVARPNRSTIWSAWVAASAAAGNQVVAVAALATSVPPDTITTAMLDPQSRFELGLMTATDDALGSVSQQVAEATAKIRDASMSAINAMLDARDAQAAIRVENRIRNEADLSLAAQITTVQAEFNGNAALVQQQFESVATQQDAQATALQSLSTAVDGQTAQVIVLAQSIDGISGRYGIAVTANGEVLGLVQLDASAVAGSSFTVVADNFAVSKPGVSVGTAVPLFSIQVVDGVSKLALRGDMIADGAILARHIEVLTLSALSADLGTVTAGLIRNTQNTLRFDLPNMRIYRTDGTMEINFASKIIDIQF